jgi:hypothetical protein
MKIVVEHIDRTGQEDPSHLQFYSNWCEPQHLFHHLDFEQLQHHQKVWFPPDLGLSEADCAEALQGGGAFEVWRLDDNGGEFHLKTCESKRAAECLVAEMTRKGHKQEYWTVPVQS